eukprot:GEMP01031428.1.p1 GENE.GEMP01031428.1~~GEMP01031428.1.p1  ORF type:complete len:440 (-),score=89.11 GEMP01031428.1:814-2133(-)
MPKKSLFFRIGGEDAVSAVVKEFYKALLSDKRVSKFFAYTKMDHLIEHQKNFLTVAFGGPNAYTGKTIRVAHSTLGITEADFGAVAENLVKVLKAVGVSQDMINEVVEIVMSVKGDVVTGNSPGGDAAAVTSLVEEFHKTLQTLRPAHPDFGSGTDDLVKVLKSSGVNQNLIDEVAGAVASVKGDIGQNKSLFDRLGGENAISAVVEEFYNTLLSDDRVKRFFATTNMYQLKRHQKAFLTVAFGGPSAYTGKDLRSVHADLGIAEDDFNAVAEDLVKVLKGVGVSADLVKEVVTIVGSVKGDIISSKSLFERLGGDGAISAVVDKLYEELLKDKRVSHFFSATDLLKLKKHQRDFLTLAFGGPNAYKGKSLLESHAALGITEQHFGAVAENVIKVLKAVGVDQKLIDEVVVVLLSVKGDVVSTVADGKTAPPPASFGCC